MPTYEFLCQADDCRHEWEDFLSIVAPDPEECPKCHTTGKVLRLISGGSGKGKVVLTGDELVAKVKTDAQQLQKDAAKDENIYSNLLGSDRYHQLQTKMDRHKR